MWKIIFWLLTGGAIYLYLCGKIAQFFGFGRLSDDPDEPKLP